MGKTIWTVGSFGGGIQTSAAFLLNEEGKLMWKPKQSEDRLEPIHVDEWMMGDPEDESADTYEWIPFLQTFGKTPLTIHRRGNLMHDAVHATKRRPTLPYWQEPSEEALREGKKDAKTKRTCTDLYKLEPIYQEMRRRMGYAKGQVVKHHHVRVIIGISCDESSRMGRRRHPWVRNVYPLVDMWKSRQWCDDYVFSVTGRHAPRSACVNCPFRDDRGRLALRPEEQARAVEFDSRIRNLSGYRKPIYIHRSLKPLGEVDLEASLRTNQLNLFEGQCAAGGSYCGT